ncbi:MAG: hypothetical protein M1818_006593 [Claussenomyces sp. TS43310]|nr:MAG: hypothetical protein M1818_006593 [Claussenomyces sp. TS43310]
MTNLFTQGQDFDPDVQDGSGWTPLMIAASLKDGQDLTNLLLMKEAHVNQTSKPHFVYGVPVPDPINLLLRFQWTASKNNLDIAKLLLSNNPPASTRVRDKRGQYPIHRAAAVGSVPMVDLFLKNRSPLNAVDTAGQTPLHHAIAEGHGDTAVALLKAGAEPDKKDVDGLLAMDLAPDPQVSLRTANALFLDIYVEQVRKFILRSAEQEGIEL